MTYCCLIIPSPVSVNAIWRGRGRHVSRSQRYMAWLTEAGIALAQQKPLPRYDDKVAVVISVGRTKRKADIDNRGKAVLDLLVKHGVLADDSLVDDLRLRWADDVTGCRVEIEPLSARVAA